MLVIGKNPVYELLKSSPEDFSKIILMKALKPEARLKEIVKLAETQGISVLMLNRYDFAN